MLHYERIKQVDQEIYKVFEQELNRQQTHLELIASENFVDEAVLEASGSILTNKYAEGYPGRRYYGGCEFVDVAENLAIERAKKLFGAEHVKRTAPQWFPSERSGVFCDATARRYHFGDEPGPWWAFDPWKPGKLLWKNIPFCFLWRIEGHGLHRL